jgi:hypothetical protein
MVEIFTKRTELMAADESVEQHNKKRSEEIAEVERDRNGPAGLFKGTFPLPRAKLIRDEEDHVVRCPSCGHEHEGGPACGNCGIELDVDDFFSDMEDDDFDTDALEEIEADLEVELDADFAEMQGGPYFQDMGYHRRAFAQHYHHRHHPSHAGDVVTDTSEGSEVDSDEEDGGSLHEFVVPDDEQPIRGTGRNPNNRQGIQPITISDNSDSDEGGAVSNRRPRRRGWQAGNSTPSARSVVTLTESSVNGSDAGEEAELLNAGWSPLDQGNDSDTDGHVPLAYDGYHNRYGVTEDERDSDDASDTNTETMAGNGYSDDEPDTPTDISYPHPSDPAYARFNSYSRHDEHFDHFTDDDDSELEQAPVNVDRDGDTEMSASPRTSRSGRSVSITTVNTNPYARDQYSDPRSSRSVSVSTNHDYPETSESSVRGRGESVDTDGIVYGGNLGVANEIHEVEGGSSDSSIRPPPRRLPRRYHPNSRPQQYDPRISMIFAEHQQSMRGTQSNPIGLDEWDGEVRRVEPASRHRRMTAYRTMPPRRVDPLRSSRSPSATRIISPADRPSRVPRQYVRRN